MRVSERLVAVVATALLALTTHGSAATAPGTAERKRSRAADVFEVEISKVYVEETEGNFKGVRMEAKVTKVLRTASGVKVGETIVIKSRRRHMTNEQLQKSKEIFNEAPLVIRKGWSGTVYLSVENKTDSIKTFEVAIEGFSFVANRP